MNKYFLTQHAKDRYWQRFGKGHPTKSLQELVEESVLASTNLHKAAFIIEGQELRVSVSLPNLGFIVNPFNLVVITLLNVNETMSKGKWFFPKRKNQSKMFKRDQKKRHERISENARYSA